MSRIIDITDKLNFEEKPSIQIKDAVVAVNNDAPTMLEVMAILEDGNEKKRMSPRDISRLYELLFGEEQRRQIQALKLDIADFTVMIMETATAAANRYEETEGEAATPATT